VKTAWEFLKTPAIKEKTQESLNKHNGGIKKSISFLTKE